MAKNKRLSVATVMCLMLVIACGTTICGLKGEEAFLWYLSLVTPFVLFLLVWWFVNSTK